jgi:hypothetical protein
LSKFAQLVRWLYLLELGFLALCSFFIQKELGREELSGQKNKVGFRREEKTKLGSKDQLDLNKQKGEQNLSYLVHKDAFKFFVCFLAFIYFHSFKNLEIIFI